MQGENQEYRPQRTSHAYQYSFTLSKNVRTWQDFVSTFRPIRFDASLNGLSVEEISHFWKNHLQDLTVETEKVCILVPNEVNKSEVVLGGSEDNNQISPEKPDEPANLNTKANKPKAKKLAAGSKTPLNKEIIDIAISIVTSNFPQLDYDYSSLFIGNQKQLLIFRKCFAIESYLEKYRLPNTIKEPLNRLQHRTEEAFLLKVQMNRAISTFQQKLIEKISNKYARLNKELNKEFQAFSVQWRDILLDFRSKNKCRDLILNHVGAELIDLLRPICLQCDTDIIDRYCDCQADQYKDIIVLKKEDIRLKPVEEQIYEQDQKEAFKYEYHEPIKENEPPKDIRDLIFLGINFINHSYTYRVELRPADQWNIAQGIFIRSEHGQENYELNIKVKPQTSTIDVDIYPYSMGRISYEIYVWNSSGFTKSTEKIVIFNELELSTFERKILKNRSVYLLGESQYKLKFSGKKDEDETNEEMILFPFYAKHLSIKTCALACDQQGDVASWGHMYYEQQKDSDNASEQTQSVDQQIQDKRFILDTPHLTLSKKYIRKVSCGYGYGLMLSIFGSIYSMGINCYGQLGIGNFNNDPEPKEICKFTNDNSPFITDISASISGASFAINHKGELYRWGLNQVSSTNMPIYDRFGSAINFTTTPIIHKQCDPTKVSKAFIQEPVKQFEAGDGFYFALGKNGTLYGWGICKFLGIHDLLDANEKIVIDIVNPIVVMKNIDYVSAGNSHSIAITKDGRVLAWGNSKNFSNHLNEFVSVPIDISQEIEKSQDFKIIKAGQNFTTIVTKENRLRFLGQEFNFKQKEYALPFDVSDVVCSEEELIAILAD